ncbi:MAG: HD domain-containing protein [Planctomycetes bacterium]|nr:HD domain-containing protein [Planctomycetota bacterium]
MAQNGANVDVSNLVRVPASTIEFLEALNFDVYVLGPHGRLTLFCSQDHIPSPQEWSVLRQQAGRLYIKTGDRDRWRTQVAENLERLMEADAVPPLRQFELLQAVLDDSLRQTLTSADLTRTIQQSQQFGHHLVSVLTREVAVGDLFSILRHDFDTFSHVVNVSSYCVLLAVELGYSDAAELEQIVVGGLLHDIGKRYIPNRILAKAGPLTAAERDVICSHPRLGFVDLCNRKELNEGQLMMAYQHHERVDGGGYPVGVLGREMHPWARLCAVCDVFEAITGERPYRKPMTLPAALNLLSEQGGKHFDREMVQCWMSAVKRTHSTPVGVV